MIFGLIFLIVLILILLYLIGGGLLEHYHIHVIHETGLGILMGMFVGFCIYSINYDFYHNHMLFEGELFFYFILPPIIFAGGYNLKKRRFFQNFFYINLYGLLGTIVNFIIVWLITYGVNSAGYIRRYSDFDTSIALSNRDILLFSATICATDSVAALAMIKSDKYPKLFSVIFGEGMVNDSVSIILYKAVLDLVGEEEHPKPISFTFVNFIIMIGEFLKNSVCSLLVGLFWGLLATLITKKFRFLAHSPVIETVIVLLLGFCSFATSEILDLSGVISILVSGIIMSHYLFYNISQTGKVTTGVTFASISTIAEAALYVYLGIIVWQTKGEPHNSNSFAWSWTFLVMELGIAFFARFCSIFVVSWVVMVFKGKETWRLNRYEMGIVWFSGVIRGAIAFALIQSVPGDESTPQIQIIQSTTLFIVILTTVVLGGLMPNYIKVMLRQIENNPRYPPDHPSIEDVLVSKEKKKKKEFKSQSQKKFGQFDELIIKPMFIYDYANRKEEISKEKLNLKMNSAQFNTVSFFRTNVNTIPSLDSKSIPHDQEAIQNEIENDPTTEMTDVVVVVSGSSGTGVQESSQLPTSVNRQEVDEDDIKSEIHP